MWDQTCWATWHVRQKWRKGSQASAKTPVAWRARSWKTTLDIASTQKWSCNILCHVCRRLRQTSDTQCAAAEMGRQHGFCDTLCVALYHVFYKDLLAYTEVKCNPPTFIYNEANQLGYGPTSFSHRYRLRHSKRNSMDDDLQYYAVQCDAPRTFQQPSTGTGSSAVTHGMDQWSPHGRKNLRLSSGMWPHTFCHVQVLVPELQSSLSSRNSFFPHSLIPRRSECVLWRYIR